MAAREPGQPVQQYAFFDVDGTLINLTSMLSFLQYMERQTDCRPALETLFGGFLWRMAEACKDYLSRNQLNRAYYRNYQGRRVDYVNALGLSWFQGLQGSEPGLFKQEVVARLREHQRQGHEVVFVSGGFEACLRPIADFLGIRYLLCARPAAHAGVYDGTLLPPQTIGAGKSEAILAFLQQQGASRDACHSAYGDHISDLPMLELARHRYAVRGDAKLERHARNLNWNII